MKESLIPGQNALPDQLISSIKSAFDTYQLIKALPQAGIKPDEISVLLKGRFLRHHLDGFLANPDRHIFQLGIIGATTKKLISEPIDNANLHIELGHEDWRLCASAEQRFKDAVVDGATIPLIHNGNPLLVVKFRYKLTSLCVETFSTPYQTFVAGNFYTPTDELTRVYLEESFLEGVTDLPLFKSQWTLMRAFEPSKGDSLAKIIATTKEKAQRDMMFDTADKRIYDPTEQKWLTRKEYRLNHWESIENNAEAVNEFHQDIMCSE